MMARSVFSFFLFIALCVWFIGPIYAETEFRFDSFADYYGGFEQSEGYENLRSRVFFRPRYSSSDDESGTEWVVSGTLWAQAFDSETFIDPFDIPYENYFIKTFSKFDMVMGQKIITYGFADIYGPLNMLHSTNRVLLSLDDAFDTRRADPLFQLRFYPTYEDTMEFTCVPFTRPDKERSDDVFLAETGDTVVWSDDPFIVETTPSLFFNYSHYGEKFDFQFMYGWYLEHTPDFDIDEINSSEKSDITTVYNRKQTIGVAYATRLGDATVSQDFALNLTEDFSGKDLGAQDSDITVNTQILAYLPWNILSQYSIVYSYFFNHSKYSKGNDEQAAEYLVEQIHDFHNQPYQHIAFVVGHFERYFLREKLKAAMNVGFFFSPEVYIAPRVAYSINDYSTWESGIDYTFGDPKDIELRRNPSNDNFYTRILVRY